MDNKAGKVFSICTQFSKVKDHPLYLPCVRDWPRNPLSWCDSPKDVWAGFCPFQVWSYCCTRSSGISLVFVWKLNAVLTRSVRCPGIFAAHITNKHHSREKTLTSRFAPDANKMCLPGNWGQRYSWKFTGCKIIPQEHKDRVSNCCQQHSSPLSWIPELKGLSLASQRLIWRRCSGITARYSIRQLVSSGMRKL